jgi:hypothetical protein
MRELAERGEIQDLVLKMHERELILREVSRVFKARKCGSSAAQITGEIWSDVVSVLSEFEVENTRLIEVLKKERRVIARKIAEAEGHRRLAAYAV